MPTLAARRCSWLASYGYQRKASDTQRLINTIILESMRRLPTEVVAGNCFTYDNKGREREDRSQWRVGVGKGVRGGVFPILCCCFSSDIRHILTVIRRRYLTLYYVILILILILGKGILFKNFSILFLCMYQYFIYLFTTIHCIMV